MNKYTLVLSTLVSTALCVLSLPAVAQGGIKLGFLVAQSGPLGVIGAEQKRGLDLALEHLGNKLGGLPVEVFSAD